MKDAANDLKLTIKGQEVTIAKEDHYFTEDGNTPVIKHAPLKKLAAQFGVRIERTVLEFPPVPTVDGIFVAHRAFGKDKDGNEVSAIGESNPGNLDGLAVDYPIIMSNKRAEDRLLITLLELEGQVYSDSEIPPAAGSTGTQEDDDSFPIGKYKGKQMEEVLAADRNYLEWFATKFEAKSALHKKKQERAKALLAA